MLPHGVPDRCEHRRDSEGAECHDPDPVPRERGEDERRTGEESEACRNGKSLPHAGRRNLPAGHGAHRAEPGLVIEPLLGIAVVIGKIREDLQKERCQEGKDKHRCAEHPVPERKGASEHN